MNSLKMVIWDWNGTLLNDVYVNLGIVNEMLSEAELSQIPIDVYRSIFAFPMISFYKSLGFKITSDKDYECLIDKYNKMYRQKMFNMSLYENAECILKRIDQLNIRQSIVSGQNEKSLFEQIQRFGIGDYFNSIRGSSTNDATDKKACLSKTILEQQVAPENILVIGDTVYDYDLATYFGCHCILLSHGHQNAVAFSNTTAKVFKGFSEQFLEYIISNNWSY